MADCGATGSALDRVTRVIGGNHNHGLSAILTTSTAAATTSSSTQLLPSAPPEYLPQLQMMPFGSMIASSNPPAAALAAPPTSTSSTMQQYPPPTMMQQHQYPQYHQHHHQPILSQQHRLPQTMSLQQQMMMQMQMQQYQQQAMMGMMLQQQQHMKQQQQASSNSTTTELQQPQPPPDELGVNGSARHKSLQELSDAWKEAMKTNFTDDDLPATTTALPASIQELSEAWWEANNNTTTTTLEEDWQVDVANELNDFYGLDEWGNPETYEFKNKISQADIINNTVVPTDYMEEGMRHFQAGDINDAIRAFEMELQQQQQQNDGDTSTANHAAKAWRMLGRCHAEQDMDGDAILCLEQAVEVDPYNVAARLELGVSYVNELQYDRALEQLKAWVTHNPQFVVSSSMNDVSTVPTTTTTLADVDIYGSSDGSSNSPFDEVQRLLLGALSSTTESQTLADVYTSLGVVYNVSRDYDAAIDAFQKAISYLSPDSNNYQLYNKLGATLANHNQSEQALSHYRRALQIKPKYARAWLNTAISHANLHQYEEAAKCYLQTLSLNPSALHCWSYLRTAVACCGAEQRDELMPLVTERNLEALRARFGLEML